MNVATLNQNNNAADSVVMPPRRNALSAWWTAEDFTDGGTSKFASHLHDRSGKGNHLTQTDADEQPSRAVLSGQFGGRNVFYFDEQDSGANYTMIENKSADLTALFGSAISQEADPEFTIAAVMAEHPTSAGSEKWLAIDSSTTTDSVYLMRHNSGIAFRVRGSVDNTFDTGGVLFTDNTAQTLIFRVTKDGAGEMLAYMWLGGTLVDWDDVGVGTNYPMDPATLRNMDEIVLGNDWFGYIGELLIWDGSHSAAEITETLNYLRDKWDTRT